MRVAVICLAVAAVFGTTAFFLSIQNTEEDESISLSEMEASCGIACSNAISLHRSDPSIPLSSTEFCTLNFDTSSQQGIFTDHCYEEDGDVLRHGCTVSSTDGSTVELNAAGCSI